MSSKDLSEGHECPSVHPLSVLVLEVWVRVLIYMSMPMGMCVVSTSLLSMCFFIF